MRSRHELTPKQRLFCGFFAATGNATESARLAGYKPGRGVRTTAWRLKNRADIRRLSALRRASANRRLETKVARALLDEIKSALTNGISTPACDRAIRLMHRLGMFPCDPFASGKRAEPEIRLNEEQCSRILELAENARMRESQRTATAEG